MKNRFESAEVFEQFAELDVIHFALEQERYAMMTDTSNAVGFLVEMGRLEKELREPREGVF